MNTLIRFGLLLLVSAPVHFGALAQEARTTQSGAIGMRPLRDVQPSSSNFVFAKPNELTIAVNLIGYVQRPGRYEISSSVNLINLLSLAGGPAEDGSISNVTVTRLVEAEGKISRREFKIDLEDIDSVKVSDLALRQGDLVEVGRTSWPFWRNTITVAVAAASLITMVSYVFIARHN